MNMMNGLKQFGDINKYIKDLINVLTEIKDILIKIENNTRTKEE